MSAEIVEPTPTPVHLCTVTSDNGTERLAKIEEYKQKFLEVVG